MWTCLKWQTGRSIRTSYDNDSTKRWENRDPRFRRSIYVDRDTAGFDPKTVLKLFDNGATKGNRSQCPTSYVVHKFWPRGINLTDGTYDGFRFATPLIRLADVYLMYAEAVNEAYGPTGSAPDAGGFSAVDAVNHVRARANMPPVTDAATGYDEVSGNLYKMNEPWNFALKDITGLTSSGGTLVIPCQKQCWI